MTLAAGIPTRHCLQLAHLQVTVQNGKSARWLTRLRCLQEEALLALPTSTAATNQDYPMAPCDSDGKHGMRLSACSACFCCSLATPVQCLATCELGHSWRCGAAGLDTNNNMVLSSQYGMVQARNQAQSTAGAVASDSIIAYLLREAVRTRGNSDQLSEHNQQLAAQTADGCQSTEVTANSRGLWGVADKGNNCHGHSSLVPKVDLAISAAQPCFSSPAQVSQVQQMSAGQAECHSRPAMSLQALAEKCCVHKLSARV